MLQTEFGSTKVYGYKDAIHGNFHLRNIPLDGLDPQYWELWASISINCDSGMKGYVYPAWQSSYAVYHNAASNAPHVNAAKPPWPTLDVGLSALIVRLMGLFPDATFTFMDRK